MCVCVQESCTNECVFVRNTGRVWECKRHVGGGVASKLQKKLIKKEKRERMEEMVGGWR